MKITDFIICEDVRYEADDKFSLMGVARNAVFLPSSPLNTPEWPKPFSFGVMIRCISEKKSRDYEITHCELFVLVGDKEYIIGKAQISNKSMEESRNYCLVSKVGNLPVGKPSNITGGIRFFNDKKEIVDVICSISSIGIVTGKPKTEISKK